jgi:hypothetical protein
MHVKRHILKTNLYMHGEELNFFQKDITSDFLEHFATEEV